MLTFSTSSYKAPFPSRLTLLTLLHHRRTVGKASSSREIEGSAALTRKHSRGPRLAYSTPPIIAPSPAPSPQCSPETTPCIVVCNQAGRVISMRARGDGSDERACSGKIVHLVIPRAAVQAFRIITLKKSRRHATNDMVSLIHPPVLSTCPLHTNSGCGKGRRILIGPW